MTICKYYSTASGCFKGNDCKFEHSKINIKKDPLTSINKSFDNLSINIAIDDNFQLTLQNNYENYSFLSKRIIEELLILYNDLKQAENELAVWRKQNPGDYTSVPCALKLDEIKQLTEMILSKEKLISKIIGSFY